jgi:CRISPR system Cascade subunit CasA
MNLTTEAWIPVVWVDGKPGKVSLREAFERGDELRDLVVRPDERIAVMRLLICIAQAALDGPGELEDWELCRSQIAPRAIDYLGRWQGAFELFGNGQRFLQVPNLKKPRVKNGSPDRDNDDDATPASKLDLALATGNNTTLFDNAGGLARAFTPGDLALMLLSYQCFSPGGTIGVALWNGIPTVGWSSYPKVKPGQSDHAPCLAGGMLHALLRGDTLRDSIHLNLMTKWQSNHFFGANRWGRPIWEKMPERPGDLLAEGNATTSYLGRLVPLARTIWLSDDGPWLLLANGLKYASYPTWREPSTTVAVRSSQKGQAERQLVRVSVEKAAWRELHALTIKDISQGQNAIGGPAALANAPDNKAFDLWVGGLVTNKAKPVDTAESVFHIPAEMLTEPSRRAYERGVRHAEHSSFRVKRAVSVFHREQGDDLDRPEMRNRRQQIQNNALVQFWSDVESAVSRLLDVVSNPASLDVKEEWHKTIWGEAVQRAARDAYERACPHETPRQIRAYALGLRALAATNGRSDQEMEPEEDE